jgi:pyruvate dehydrogenase E2 component (dihydrolipoamide acetyltransferase)
VIVPKLGMASAVVTLAEWRVGEGEWVEQGDPVLDIEAEKTTHEMTATAAGYLHILAPSGTEADVSTVVGLIAATQDEYVALTGGSIADIAASGAAPAPPATSSDARGSVEPSMTSRSDVASANGGRLFITPIARRMASERGIAFSTIAGSGPRGRIQKRDVEEAIAALETAPRVEKRVVEPISIGAASHGDRDSRVREVIPYAGMRRAIGENMMKSLLVNAPNTMSGDFDLSVLVKYREHFLSRAEALGTRVTYSDLLIHAVARALRQMPLLNSSLIDNEIRLWEDINIGMAVALGERGEQGLVVPVVRNADQLGLVEISRAVRSLGERARAGQLAPSDMRGGTFTVTNFGSLGVSSYSTPIINPPESAILGFGRLQKKPIVRNGGIVVAPMLPYSLTHDHRVIDGAVAEAFLGLLKGLIESTSAELNDLILF